MKLDIDDVMATADAMYSCARDEQGRPQRGTYGIESDQVKALAKALVEKINEVLERKQ